MMRLLRWSSAPLLALFAAAATAEFHTFKIEELYSNADGSVQFVVLHESQNMDGESFLTGVPLISTSAGGTNSFVFEKDLGRHDEMCGGYYDMCMPTATANKRVLIGSVGFAALGLIKADYVIPNGFLATDGGTVNYGGVDSITYVALPTDGANALYRDGTTHQNLATNFGGAAASVGAAAPAVTVVEYHHASFDHYFITPKARRNSPARRPRAAVPGLVADRVYVQCLCQRHRASGVSRYLPLLQRHLRAEEFPFLRAAWLAAAMSRSRCFPTGAWKTTSSSTQCFRT